MDDDTEDPDDIMCNFIPMVKEYLTCKFNHHNYFFETLINLFYSTRKGN